MDAFAEDKSGGFALFVSGDGHLCATVAGACVMSDAQCARFCARCEPGFCSCSLSAVLGLAACARSVPAAPDAET